MMKKNITTLFLVTLFSLSAICQDTLRMLDGHILNVKIGKISEAGIAFSKTKKTKNSYGFAETEEIFSYSKKEMSEVLIYKYNPEIGNIYELNEMRDYMTGEQHARQHYHPLISKIVAFGTGVWSGYAISDGSHIFVATPLLISSIIMIPGTRVQKNELNEAYFKNNAYRSGYKRVAKGKRFFNTFKLSALGMLGSFIVFEATD